MNNAKKYIGLIFILIFVAQACKTKKQTKDIIGIDANTMMLWDKIDAANLDFNWFYAKANANVSFEGMSFGGKADIRIKKDEKILMSVKKFGFEVGRSLFTPDSVYVINRIQGQYGVRSFEEIQNDYNLPFGFAELQELIVGNNITRGQNALSSINTDQGYLLKSSDENVAISYQLNKDYMVESSSLIDAEGRSFEVDMKNYKVFGNGHQMATERSYSYPNSKTPEYTLEFKLDKVEIDKPKKIKFEPPARYKRM